MLKLALGIPIIGEPNAEAYGTHLALAAEMGNHGQLVISTAIGLAPHDRARNKIFKDVLEAGSKFLMFVDADMRIPVGAFQRLWETIVATKAVMVTAHCYRRGYPFTVAWSKVMDDTGGLYQVDTNKRKPVEIHGCGFPCTLIDLEWVKENLDRPWFLVESDGDKRTKWEDWHFCERIRKMGGKIYGEPRVRCGHYGLKIDICDETVEWLRANYIKENMSNDDRS